jgi:ariadne-1
LHTLQWNIYNNINKSSFSKIFPFLFSWLCGGPTGKEHTWTSISGHSCGQYKEDQGKKTERAKMDLLRYIHYHNLFKAHTDSFKREAELKETIQEKISHLEERQSSKDFSWVTNGLDRLFRSRRVLSYSYPFAYYMFGDDSVKLEMTKEEKEIKQNLFEEQQQQLHANVEKLSLFMGEPFDRYPEDEVEELRMKIINLSVITDRLCRKL